MSEGGSAPKLALVCDTLISAGSALASTDGSAVKSDAKSAKAKCQRCGLAHADADSALQGFVCVMAAQAEEARAGSAVKSPLSGSALTDGSEEAMTDESGSALTEPPHIKTGYTVAAVKTVPCSCRCGGEAAYALDLGGLSVMLGCVCHTWFDASTSQFVRRMDKPAQKEELLKLRVYHSTEK